ncbi:MAG: PadR family transcriptional regulator [Acidimicrobiales bacterium]
MSEPTTTSFAVLALLAVRPWTAYELAQQMERSVATMWPRAASVVYEEPKRLVGRGLASARKQYTGRRASTEYTITDAGRAALAGVARRARRAARPSSTSTPQGGLCRPRIARWPPRQPRRHPDRRGSPALVHGTAVAGYAESGGPFPDRLPVIALADRYFAERNRALLRWVEWAEAVVAEWEGVTPASRATVPVTPFADEHRALGVAQTTTASPRAISSGAQGRAYRRLDPGFRSWSIRRNFAIGEPAGVLRTGWHGR